jgi:filamentous hemagglutinin family protein
MLLFDSLYKSRYIVGLLGWLTVGSVAWTQYAVAQVTPDATLGAESSTVTSTTVNGVPSELINGGASRGQNLFHSFLNFSIQAGRGAYFSNPSGILNILSRVTGNNPSNLNGTLGVLGNANLFFLNPNGIVFGANASLDVKGSFLATTADGIQFGDQGSFSAINPTAPAVLTVNPSALLFNQIAAQPINSQATLRVPEGRSLLLAGGPVSLDGGGLSAPGGSVELASLSSTGTLGLDVAGNQLSFSYPASTARANVTLNDAFIDVDAASSGSTSIYGQNLDLSNAFLTSNTTSGDGGAILFNASEGIVLRNDSIVQAGTSGAGSGGNLTINTGYLTVQDGSDIFTFVSIGGSGRGGNLTINASDNVTIEEGLIYSSTSSVGAAGNLTINASNNVKIKGGQIYSFNVGNGDTGDIVINTTQLALQNEGLIFTDSNSAGNAGDILINAAESITLSDPFTNPLGFQNPTRIYTQTSSTGDGGNLTINTKQLNVLDGSQIGALTFGQGNGGDLMINVTDSITVSGNYISSDGVKKGSLATQSDGVGNTGDIFINTSQLIIQDGASIGAIAFGEGKGGDIVINASKLITLSGYVATDNDFSVSIISSSSEGAGDAGRIEIITEQLTLRDGAIIFTSSLTNNAGRIGGNAGDLIINASDSIVLSGKTPDGESSFLSATTFSDGGDGGDLIINTNQLSLQDGARIDSQTFSSGNAGEMTINTSRLSLQDGAVISTSTSTSGNAGALTINTGQLIVQNESFIITLTTSSGNAGELTINASESVMLGSSATGGTPGFLGTQSFGSGNAGNLIINTRQLTVQSGSAISTGTDSSGKGGNLIINASDSVIVGGADADGSSSLLSTSTFGSGNAGDLEINTKELTVQDGAGIATSAFSGSSGNAGNLEINTGELTVQGGASITTFADSGSSGEAGDLTINAADSVTVIGTATDGTPSALFTSTFSSGNAGDLEINTRALTVLDGAVITTFAFGGSSGEAGDLTINASDSVTVNGISTGGFTSSLITSTLGSGNAGDLTINTKVLIVENQGVILSSTFGEGDGGDISINASDAIILKGTAGDEFSTGLFSTSEAGASGAAGDITVTTGDLLIENQALITATTATAGAGGDINITANSVMLQGNGTPVVEDLPTGIFALTSGSGNAGTITLTTSDLQIRNQAGISVQSVDTGDAGEIKLLADTINLDNGTILASADQSGGGDIEISAQDITLTNNSLISTNVFDSTGGGGDIKIAANTFIALENSDILATADEGPGGNITITANTFLANVFANNGPTPSDEADFQTLRNNGRVDISASSAESVSGQVNIPDLNLLQKALDDGNVSFIRADQIVASSCLTKGARRGNKFTMSGTGGIAQTPYKAIQMDFHAEEIDSVQASFSQAQQPEQDKLEQANVSQVWRLGDPIQEATGILITADGRLRLDSKAPIAPLKESQELICR